MAGVVLGAPPIAVYDWVPGAHTLIPVHPVSAPYFRVFLNITQACTQGKFAGLHLVDAQHNMFRNVNYKFLVCPMPNSIMHLCGENSEEMVWV